MSKTKKNDTVQTQDEEKNNSNFQAQLSEVRELADKLQKENEALREQQRQQSLKSTGTVPNFLQEVEAIRKAGKNKVNVIEYKDVHDHKNIPLFHTNGLHVGKMVGPIHPGNAEEVLMRFYKLGIILSHKKPTPEQVDEYKSTDEYKRLKFEFERVRSVKERTRKDTEVERLIKSLENLGVPRGQMNNIRAPEEVGSVAKR